ncbi:UDP-glucose/GDP-mannose dehydrogenase family protein [Chitinimonas sp. BJYL2]|uniref:UDP-glucose dehydrogenase family protein n=1 Tax=Chitinimonas sp. BJYL2 TaxID=2976696 RepID=UPI0022B30751|nr:UDP-glucose/GDP-mannose dehydrogenase family protein [Chitinimonas sp. BJYL2]
MKLTVVGAGYVGLVTAACLAEVGNDVLCVEHDPAKVAALREGRIPIFEPGLEALVRRNAAASRLHFATDDACLNGFGDIQMIAVGTPPDEDGSADLQYVLAAARGIAERMTGYTVVVTKSTVPVGTADLVRDEIRAVLAQRGLDIDFAVVSNPEFLKEGAAVEDFMRPDRIIIGSNDARATEQLRALYQPFQRNHERMQVMDIRSAELTKYAANAMLATRISFMNEMANLAEALGADIEMVRKGIGSDSRIGYHFLYAGLGYGGSCLPKDVKALRRTAQMHDVNLRLLTAVDEVNAAQKQRLVSKLMRHLGQDMVGRHIALWGLAFKPNTDDMREAPSLSIIEGLLSRGATVTVYDPVASAEAQRMLGARVAYADSPMAALSGADALLIATEWKEFRSPDFEQMRRLLKQPLIIDGRNLYDPIWLRAQGYTYEGIGR